MATKYLDSTGLAYLWGKIKEKFQVKLVSGTNIKTINNQSLLGSGNISISGGGVTPYDYITERGTSGKWTYEKWNSGKVEAWYAGSVTPGSVSQNSTNKLYFSHSNTLAIPSGIFPGTPTHIMGFVHQSNGRQISIYANPASATSLTWQIWQSTNSTAAFAIRFHAIYFPD
jgi:hypothetical protein